MASLTTSQQAFLLLLYHSAPDRRQLVVKSCNTATSERPGEISLLLAITSVEGERPGPYNVIVYRVRAVEDVW